MMGGPGGGPAGAYGGAPGAYGGGDPEAGQYQHPGYAGQQPPPGYQQPGTAPTGAPPTGATPYKMSSTNPINLIWFAAACCVMIGSLIGFFSEFFSLQWVDAVENVYFFAAGALLACLDTPLFNNMLVVTDMRNAIGKYIAALQRVTGKGVTYIFLGCALWSSMFANMSGFLLFLSAFIGLFVVFIGVVSLVVAILKSRNLDLVRLELRKDGAGSLQTMYDMHAKMHPQMGITQEEFKKLTPYARGVVFEQPDIRLIFNALCSNPRREYLSLQDLQAWVNGPHMIFI